MTATISPSVSFTPIYSSALQQFPAGGTCGAAISIPSNSGVGQVQSNASASTGDCSGVIGTYAAALGVTSNTATIVVPPAPLVRQMLGAARDYTLTSPGSDPGQVAQRSVGIAAKNRFGRPEFGSGTSWLFFQQNGSIENYFGFTYPQLTTDNAAAVYTGQVNSGFVEDGVCYWSPQNFETTIIQGLANSQTTQTPTGLLWPGCYPAGQRQIVWKTSMPTNIRSDTQVYNASPAFMFIRTRQANQPVVVQIP